MLRLDDLGGIRLPPEFDDAPNSKYRSRKTVIDGIKFASRREAKRYVQLKILEKHKLITDLQLQAPFVLAPSVVIDGRKRPALRYFADFVYVDERGIRHVEDAKGVKTEGYRIKRHLLKAIYGINIEEI